jgi:branched-chain amino acid transport system substrate-binding protein
MTRKRFLSWTAALAAVTLSIAACTSSSDQEGGAGSVSEVRIGVLVPKSGESAAAGAEALHGAELAARLVNGDERPVPLAGVGSVGLAGLGGAKLSIVSADTQSKPEVGAAEAARLVTEKQVVGLVGAYDTVVTEVASQRTERLQVPFVNDDSPAGYLTERGLDWFFRVGPTDRMFGEAFFSALSQTPGAGVHKIALVYADDRPSNVVALLTKELAEEGGFQRVGEAAFSPGPNGNPVAAVTQLRNLPNQPDAVFAIASTPGDATRLVKAFGQARYSPPGIVAAGSGFLPSSVLAATGSAGEGLFTGTAWSREIAGRNASAKPVMDLYEERYNQPMSDIAAGTFTAMLVLADAINSAGSTDSQRVRGALLNLDIPAREMIMPWTGLRFDAAHQNVAANGVVEQRVQGLFRVVFPDELQRAKPVWPRPGASA